MEPIEDLNPAVGEVIAEVASGGARKLMLRCPKRGFPNQLPPNERALYALCVACIIIKIKHFKELAELRDHGYWSANPCNQDVLIHGAVPQLRVLR